MRSLALDRDFKMFAVPMRTARFRDAAGDAVLSHKHVLTLADHWDFPCHKGATRYFFVSIYIFFPFLQLSHGSSSCIQGVNHLFVYVN